MNTVFLIDMMSDYVDYEQKAVARRNRLVLYGDGEVAVGVPNLLEVHVLYLGPSHRMPM